MDEYTCSVCNEKFDEEEKKLTNDECKCILHCEKDPNKSYPYLAESIESILNNINDNFPDNYSFDKYVFSFDAFQNSSLHSFKNATFTFNNCTFYCGTPFSESNLLSNITQYENCHFYGENNFQERKKNQYFNFVNCTFHNIIYFKDIEFTGDKLFHNCSFSKKFNSLVYNKLNDIVIRNCTLKTDFNLNENKIDRLKIANTNIYKIKNFDKVSNLSIFDCTVIEEFILENDIRSLQIQDTIFKEKVEIKDYHIDNMKLDSVRFKEFCNFENTTFNNIQFENTIFEKLVTFQKTQFLESVDFNYVTFKDHSIFKNSIFKDKINLENTLFEKNPSFYAVTSEENKIEDIQVSNRETARIIKESFEKDNNIIEANRFYKLEMKEREKEIKWYEIFDLFVFKFHSWSSNHSQNWILPLFWIFLISYFVTSVKTTYGFFETILYNIFIYGVLDKMANVINPFSIMTKEESLTFSMLFFKVIIAYLIYQFIVSVRQNTRRK